MTTTVPASMIGAFVTPETFGAKGDNTNDDTAALNAAAVAAGAWGQVFLNPAKTYRITAAVTPLIGQRWYGGGKITTANGFNHHVFSLVGITDVTIEGLRAESGTLGVAIASATARFVAATASSHRCKVLRCHVTGFQSAVQFNASTDCRAIDNTIVTPYGWGINIQTDADYAEASYNRISGVAGEHGIYVAGSAGNAILAPQVIRNTITGSAIDGIKVSRAGDALVQGNVCNSNTGQGIYLTVGCDRAKVFHNTTASNGENGILVFDSTETSDRNRVEHNTVRKNDKNGISVSSSGSGTVSRTRVVDNDIEDNDQEATTTQYGIVVSGAGTTLKTEVRDNRVTDETIGIRIASGNDTRVGQNTYENCGTSLSDAGTATVIEHETSGATATVTDGATITHGHPKTPTSVIATGSVASQFVSVTAIGATTFTVAIKTDGGGAGSSQTVYWRARG
jgi:parallel beta-helix repeat protein